MYGVASKRSWRCIPRLQRHWCVAAPITFTGERKAKFLPALVLLEAGERLTPDLEDRTGQCFLISKTANCTGLNGSI